MYPTIIVILVHKSSTEDDCGISVLMANGEVVVMDVEARPVTFGHLSFAAPQSTTAGSTSTEGLNMPTDYHSVQGEISRVVIGEDNSMSSKGEHHQG